MLLSRTVVLNSIGVLVVIADLCVSCGEKYLRFSSPILYVVLLHVVSVTCSQLRSKRVNKNSKNKKVPQF